MVRRKLIREPPPSKAAQSLALPQVTKSSELCRYQCFARGGKEKAGDPLFPPLANSDFSGGVYLTLSEAKIDFKPIEPRNPWVDALGFELGRQVLVVLS
jgi:hypothetical protein